MMLKILISWVLGFVEALVGMAQFIINYLSWLLAQVRIWLHKDYNYQNWLKRDLADCNSILELGCGNSSPLLKIGLGKRTYAVDIWQPYVDKHNAAKDYRECWQADIQQMQFTPKGWDAVVLCDVLEHLPKSGNLLAEIERLAQKKVVIFTPNGKVGNEITDGNQYQNHQSIWEAQDYRKQGYKVKGATGLKYVLGSGTKPKYHPYFIFNIVATLSQPFVLNNPELAFHSYAVKEINGTN